MLTPLRSGGVFADGSLGIEAQRVDASRLLGGLPVRGPEPEGVEPPGLLVSRQPGGAEFGQRLGVEVLAERAVVVHPESRRQEQPISAAHLLIDEAAGRPALDVVVGRIGRSGAEDRLRTSRQSVPLGEAVGVEVTEELSSDRRPAAPVGRDLVRRRAEQVDRDLRGLPPGDVELAQEFAWDRRPR